MLFLFFLLTSGKCRTPLSCSPNFPRQYQYRQYLDIRTQTHELIVKYAKKEQSYVNNERPMNHKNYTNYAANTKRTLQIKARDSWRLHQWNNKLLNNVSINFHLTFFCIPQNEQFFVNSGFTFNHGVKE